MVAYKLSGTCGAPPPKCLCLNPHLMLGHFHFLVGWQQDKLQPGQTQPDCLVVVGSGRQELVKITGIFQAACSKLDWLDCKQLCLVARV